jgi:hypothetical protein
MPRSVTSSDEATRRGEELEFIRKEQWLADLLGDGKERVALTARYPNRVMETRTAAKEIPMFEFWLPLLPFLFVLLFMGAFRSRQCPDCGNPLPTLQSPFSKTRRQWTEGGYVCPVCGCESDAAGRKIMPGTPVKGVSRSLQLGLAVAVALGLGLTFYGFSARAVAPVAVAAPAVAVPLGPPAVPAPPLLPAR